MWFSDWFWLQLCIKGINEKSEKWIGNACRSNYSKGPSKTVPQKLCHLSSLSTDADVNSFYGLISLWRAPVQMISQHSASGRRKLLRFSCGGSDVQVIPVQVVCMASLFLFFSFFSVVVRCLLYCNGLVFCSTDFIIRFLLLEYCLLRGVGQWPPEPLSSLDWPVWIRTLCLT